MTDTEKRSPSQRVEAFFDRILPTRAIKPITVALIVSVVAALIWGWQDQRVNHAQDETRIADQHTLSVCVSGILGTLVGSLPPVRNATQKRDEATRRIVLDLAKVVALASENKKASPAFKGEFASDLFTYLTDDAAVTQARKSNPYPPTPKKLCVLDAH